MANHKQLLKKDFLQALQLEPIHSFYFDTMRWSVFLAAATKFLALTGVPADRAFVSRDVWKDILEETKHVEFSAFDAVTKIDLTLEGCMGNLYGVNIISDFYWPEEERVIPEGSIFFTGRPEINDTAFPTIITSGLRYSSATKDFWEQTKQALKLLEKSP